MKIFSFSNLVLFVRLIFSPLMLPFLIVYLLPYNILWINGLLAFIFVILSVADFFDVFLFRKLQQKVSITKLLTLMAGKFLSYSALVALLVVNKIFFYWVIVIILSGFFVMGLRMIALENNFSINISFLERLGNILQMIYLTVIILNPYQSLGLKNIFNQVQLGLLVVVIALTLIISQKSLRLFLLQMNAKEQQS